MGIIHNRKRIAFVITGAVLISSLSLTVQAETISGDNMDNYSTYESGSYETIYGGSAFGAAAMEEGIAFGRDYLGNAPPADLPGYDGSGAGSGDLAGESGIGSDGEISFGEAGNVIRGDPTADEAECEAGRQDAADAESALQTDSSYVPPAESEATPQGSTFYQSSAEADTSPQANASDQNLSGTEASPQANASNQNLTGTKASSQTNVSNKISTGIKAASQTNVSNRNLTGTEAESQTNVSNKILIGTKAESQTNVSNKILIGTKAVPQTRVTNTMATGTEGASLANTSNTTQTDTNTATPVPDDQKDEKGHTIFYIDEGSVTITDSGYTQYDGSSDNKVKYQGTINVNDVFVIRQRNPVVETMNTVSVGTEETPIGKDVTLMLAGVRIGTAANAMGTEDAYGKAAVYVNVATGHTVTVCLKDSTENVLYGGAGRAALEKGGGNNANCQGTLRITCEHSGEPGHQCAASGSCGILRATGGGTSDGTHWKSAAGIGTKGGGTEGSDTEDTVAGTNPLPYIQYDGGYVDAWSTVGDGLYGFSSGTGITIPLEEETVVNYYGDSSAETAETSDPQFTVFIPSTLNVNAVEPSELKVTMASGAGKVVRLSVASTNGAKLKYENAGNGSGSSTGRELPYILTIQEGETSYTIDGSAPSGSSGGSGSNSETQLTLAGTSTNPVETETTHNLSMSANLCDGVSVIYAGIYRDTLTFTASMQESIDTN